MVKKIKKWIFEKSYQSCLKIGLNLVDPAPVLKMLDTGCGNGQKTTIFIDHIKPTTIIGLDLFEQPLTDNRIERVLGDINQKIPLRDNSFDFILSNQTIEHLTNIRKYLSECYRVLSSNGQILIMTENLSSWFNIICLFFGWQPFSLVNINGWNIGNPFMYVDETKDKWNKEYEKQYQEGNMGVLGHIYVLTPKGLKDLMTRTGFKNIKIKTAGFGNHFLIGYGKK